MPKNTEWQKQIITNCAPHPPPKNYYSLNEQMLNLQKFQVSEFKCDLKIRLYESIIYYCSWI